ncbi:MAG: transcriptional regulator [Candidatus Reconcilbacillus cellulovorans]|uniref:Transcriptional regulator n=1 Tax=Candidatus Reconcilbacillus cellulovorans TaxID=1906605 RepID=A0A2A6E084_9BACL|nr:MAG: transcriptional regulator [Candidatus Reconcilbacillus cellulovorans]
MGHELGRRLRAFRKLKRLTQQELALRAGVSLSVLGEIERGVRDADPRILAKIAEILQVQVAELTGER